VLAYAPVTPAQLWKLWPADVVWESAEVYPTGRRKGTGTTAVPKPLTPDAVAAFRAFDAAGCWGHVPSRHSMWRIFRAALKQALEELRVTRPDLDLSRAATMRPYDLRHSFATVVLQTTGSLDVTAQMLGHAPGSKMVLRYAQGAVPALLKAAGDPIRRAFAAIPPYVPPPPPAAPVDFRADFRARTPPPAGDFRARLPRDSPAKSGNVRKFTAKPAGQEQAEKRGSRPQKPPKRAK